MLRFKIRPTVTAHLLDAIVKSLSFLFKDAIEVCAQHSNSHGTCLVESTIPVTADTAPRLSGAWQ